MEYKFLKSYYLEYRGACAGDLFWQFQEWIRFTQSFLCSLPFLSISLAVTVGPNGILILIWVGLWSMFHRGGKLTQPPEPDLDHGAPHGPDPNPPPMEG